MRQYWAKGRLSSHTYLFHGSSLNSVYNSHVTSFSFRLTTEGTCMSPTQPQNFWKMSPMIFNLRSFFHLRNNFQTKKNWCLEGDKAQLLSQHIQGYAETLAETSSVWFAHVTDCCCFGWREIQISFSNYENYFCPNLPILIGRLWSTLVLFIWQKHMMGNETIVFNHIQKREAFLVV